MKTSDFDYYLPEHLIAQYPIKERDKCRLLYLDRNAQNISHYFFYELPNLLLSGDLLIVNNTRVLPARLFCKKSTGGKVEILFVNSISQNLFKAMVRPARSLREKTVLFLCKDSSIAFEIDSVLSDGTRIIKSLSSQNIYNIMQKYGEVALPHYIKRDVEEEDNYTYQTFFAKKDGAIASPTAGLHFTSELISKLKSCGIDICEVTLHVGPGTFKPVKTEDPKKHKMHEEEYIVPKETTNKISETKKNDGRVIAVGTTVVRVLEHCALENGKIVPSSGKTGLFILPGYKFKVVDGIITNFHLPKSTLLMLICAFAGKDLVFKAYKEAINRQYRFYSYGDAMLIL